MKKIKRFKAFESNTERQMTPNEFAQKYNEDYNFIVYRNGKAESGYEFLSDAFEYIAENILDKSGWEVTDFLERLEDHLTVEADMVNRISMYDDVEDIKSLTSVSKYGENFEEELNSAIGEFITEEDHDITDIVTIRLVTISKDLPIDDFPTFND